MNQFTFYKEKQFGDGLGENVLIGPQNPPRPSAGAIASYASTNFELLPSDPSGRTHLNVWLFRALFQDPPSEPLHGESGARVLLGEALTLGMANSTGATFGIGAARATYCLLGDPAMPIETARAPVHREQVPVNSGVRPAGAPGDSIAFELDLVDESRIDDLTLTVTGEGARAVDPSEYVVTPSFPDTAGGGAGRRYQLLWNARPQAKDTDFNVSIRDRGGLTSSFTLPVRLEAKLFANGQAINDGETGPTSGTYQYIEQPGAARAGGLRDPRRRRRRGPVITPAPTDRRAGCGCVVARGRDRQSRRRTRVPGRATQRDVHDVGHAARRVAERVRVSEPVREAARGVQLHAQQRPAGDRRDQGVLGVGSLVIKG